MNARETKEFPSDPQDAGKKKRERTSEHNYLNKNKKVSENYSKICEDFENDQDTKTKLLKELEERRKKDNENLKQYRNKKKQEILDKIAKINTDYKDDPVKRDELLKEIKESKGKSLKQLRVIKEINEDYQDDPVTRDKLLNIINENEKERRAKKNEMMKKNYHKKKQEKLDKIAKINEDYKDDPVTRDKLLKEIKEQEDELRIKQNACARRSYAKRMKEKQEKLNKNVPTLQFLQTIRVICNENREDAIIQQEKLNENVAYFPHLKTMRFICNENREDAINQQEKLNENVAYFPHLKTMRFICNENREDAINQQEQVNNSVIGDEQETELSVNRVDDVFLANSNSKTSDLMQLSIFKNNSVIGSQQEKSEFEVESPLNFVQPNMDQQNNVPHFRNVQTKSDSGSHEIPLIDDELTQEENEIKEEFFELVKEHSLVKNIINTSLIKFLGKQPGFQANLTKNGITCIPVKKRSKRQAVKVRLLRSNGKIICEHKLGRERNNPVRTSFTNNSANTTSIATSSVNLQQQKQHVQFFAITNKEKRNENPIQASITEMQMLPTNLATNPQNSNSLVVIKEEQTLINNPENENHPVLVVDTRELREVAYNLRGRNNSEINCVWLAKKIIDYFLTGKKPVEAANQAGCSEKNFTVWINDNLMPKQDIKIKSEPNLAGQHAETLMATHVSFDLDSTVFRNLIPPGLEEHINIESGEKRNVYNLSLHSSVAIHFEQLNQVLIEVAKKNSPQVSFGIVSLHQHGEDIKEPCHIIVYHATNKVVYVDCQAIDGKKRRGEPIFYDLKERYKFVQNNPEKNKKDISKTLGNFVFYVPMTPNSFAIHKEPLLENSYTDPTLVARSKFNL